MNILVLTPYLPYPLSSGGAQGVFNMIDHLRHKHHYTLLINEGGQNNEANRRALQRLWPDVDIIYYPFVRQLMCASFFYEKSRRVILKRLIPGSRKLMLELALRPYGEWFSHHHVSLVCDLIRSKGIDLVQVEFMEGIQWAEHLPDDVKKIFIHHELGFVRKERLLCSLSLSDKEKQKLAECKAAELQQLERYDAVVTVTDTDRQILIQNGISRPVYASNLAINTESFPYSVAPGRLTFIGGYGHMPNQEGMDWFIKSVAPYLNGQQWTLNLIGTNWPGTYSESMDVNVSLKGFVEKLSDVALGSIMIVPILSGSGMRMKILEAAAMSLPIVTTTVGVEGLDFVNGESCIVADTPKEFADAIIRLSNDADLRKQLGENANRVFLARYSAPVLAGKRDEIYDKIMLL